MVKRFIQGDKELAYKLRALGGAASDKALRSAAMSATLPVLRSAQSRAPVREGSDPKRTYLGRLVAPGFLKRNIARRSMITRGGVRVDIGPKAEAFYGTQFIEIGTSRIAAQPWLRPAFYSHKNEMPRILGDKLRAKIEAIKKKRFKQYRARNKTGILKGIG